MIRPPNDDSRVIDSPLLVVPELEVNRCSKENNDTSSETTQADFNFVESLLGENGIEGFYCYRANHKREPGTRNPSVKLTISETALQREQKLPSPTKLDRSKISDPNDRFATVACIQMTSRLWVLKTEDTNGGLYFDMAPKLDLAKIFG
ncbi:unnamed protein product [Rhizophagus irregularis]|nr:unnamed protein product [Rhizophagus irregularis]